jgi:N-acetyltransferase
MIDVQPITLARGGIVLEPLGHEHVDALREAAADGQLWKLWFTSVPSYDETEAYIESALKARLAGERFHWIVKEQATGKPLGCTSYHDIVAAIDRVEIGYTWYRQSAQRSPVNTVCKLLLMEHAFDKLGCAVVGWRTDIHNHRSQRAIERLGAQRDGIIRHHGLRRDGSARNTVIYSLLRAEWPAVKTKLESRLLSTLPSTQVIKIQAIQLVEVTTMAQMRQLIKCDAGALGQTFVASNAGSVAQASITPSAWLRGVEYQGNIVGLVLLADPSLGAIEDEPQDVLWVWRLMIDFSKQHMGLGNLVMQQVINHAKTRPGIKAVRLSYVPAPGNAQPFYLRAGFKDTGKVSDGEHEMELVL